MLDVGCLGFAQVAAAREAGRSDLLHYGVDYAAAGEPNLPEGFTFAEVDLGTHGLPFPDDLFDAVVASHVMEHVPDPIALVTECIRVCKPGGVVYLECPSERTLFRSKDTGCNCTTTSASQIASASAASFLLLLTYGLTNCGAIKRTVCPMPCSLRGQWWALLQASMPIRQPGQVGK